MNSRRVVLLVCASLLGAAGLTSCRDYVVQGQAGEGGQLAGKSGSAVMSGKSGTGAESPGGQGGQSPTSAGDAGAVAETPGGAGSMYPGGAGGVGGFVDGNGGAGGTADLPADTGMFGAVRLFIGGQPVCGGTLLNNSWVLTADSCVPVENPEVMVAYGADSASPDQVEKVKELVRFPGNDGLEESRGRDLLLLGLEQPIRVHGQTAGFYQPLLAQTGPGFLLAGQVCVGWDLSPELDDETHSLRRAELTPFAVDLDAKIGPREAGDWIWWSKQPLPGTNLLALPTNQEIGIGCFIESNGIDFLASINLGIPELRRDDRDNPNIEAKTGGVSQEAIRIWVERTLLSAPEYLPLQEPLGPVTAAWSTPQTLEVLGVSQASQALLWYTRSGNDWGEAVDLGVPGGAVLSTNLRPAGLWRASGSIELFAVDELGKLWWKRRVDKTNWTDWGLVLVATTAITSGVRVAESLPGHFHLVARGASGELRHAEYEDGEWYDAWDNFGDTLMGEPTLEVLAEDRVNVFYAHPDGTVQQTYLLNGWYTVSQAGYGPIASAPATGHWSLNLFDMVGRTASGTLARLDYRGGWFPTRWLDTGLEMPADSDPYLVTRYNGHGDIFVSMGDGKVWHVEWPRRP